MNLNRLGLVWVKPKHNTALKLATHTPLYHSSLASPLSLPILPISVIKSRQVIGMWLMWSGPRLDAIVSFVYGGCFDWFHTLLGLGLRLSLRPQTSDGTSYGSYHSWFGLGPVLGGKRLSGLGAPHLLLLDEPRADKAQHKRVSGRRRGTHTPTHTQPHTHRGAYEL